MSGFTFFTLNAVESFVAGHLPNMNSFYEIIANVDEDKEMTEKVV